MQFKPFVNYKITSQFTAGLEGGFGSGHLVIGSFSPKPDSTNASNWTKNVGFVNEKHNIYVKPNLAYNFANSLALKLWYQVTFIGYADLGDDPLLANLRNSLAPKAIDNYEMVDSLLKHQVALEFIWSF